MSFLNTSKRKSASEKKITIRHITKSYNKTTVLNMLNLDINSGEFMTILGESGCGKTTLLKIISGFETADSGDICINNENILQKKPFLRNIGMVFQDYALFPHMTVYKNIAYPLSVRGLKKKEIRQRVNAMMELVKISALEHQYPKQLSGGQQQRVALARALIFNPDLLLLDEPFSALDKKLRYDMQLEVKQIQCELGITTINVTHDQDEAMTMSDKIAIMHNGIIQQCDTPQYIYSFPYNSYVANFIGDINLFECTLEKKQKTSKNTFIYFLQSSYNNGFILESIMDYPFSETSTNHCKLAIRPEDFTFVPITESYEKFNYIRAKIVNIIYLGDRVRIKLKTTKNLPVIAQTLFQPTLSFQIEDEINLRFSITNGSLIFD